MTDWLKIRLPIENYRPPGCSKGYGGEEAGGEVGPRLRQALASRSPAETTTQLSEYVRSKSIYLSVDFETLSIDSSICGFSRYSSNRCIRYCSTESPIITAYPPALSGPEEKRFRTNQTLLRLGITERSAASPIRIQLPFNSKRYHNSVSIEQQWARRFHWLSKASQGITMDRIA